MIANYRTVWDLILLWLSSFLSDDSEEFLAGALGWTDFCVWLLIALPTLSILHSINTLHHHKHEIDGEINITSSHDSDTRYESLDKLLSNYVL